MNYGYYKDEYLTFFQSWIKNKNQSEIKELIFHLLYEINEKYEVNENHKGFLTSFIHQLNLTTVQNINNELNKRNIIERLKKISNSIVQTLKIINHVNFYLDQNNLLNYIEKEDYNVLIKIKERGFNNFKNVKRDLNINTSTSKLKKNIFNTLNKLNQKFNYNYHNYESKQKYPFAHQTIITTHNVLKSKNRYLKPIRNVVRTNSIISSCYTRNLLYQITYDIEQSNNIDFTKKLLNENYHNYLMKLLVKHLYFENENEITNYLNIPEELPHQNHLNNVNELNCLLQSFKYTSSELRTNINTHLTYTMPKFLKRYIHCYLDQLEKLENNNNKFYKKNRNKIVHKVIRLFYNDEDDEISDIEQSSPNFKNEEFINNQVNKIQNHILKIMDINENQTPLSNKKITHDTNWIPTILKLYYYMNEQLKSYERKTFTLIPISSIKPKFTTFDGICMKELGVSVGDVQSVGDCYSVKDFLEIDKKIKFSRTQRENRSINSIQTNGIQFNLCFNKLKNYNDSYLTKSSVSKTNHTCSSIPENFCGIDPGIKEIMKVVTMNNQILRLTNNEYYDRIGMNKYRKMLEEYKKKFNIHTSELYESPKTTSTNQMKKHLFQFNNVVEKLYQFYSNNTLLRFKFKINSRKKRILDDFNNIIEKTLLTNQKKQKASQRYSFKKSKEKEYNKQLTNVNNNTKRTSSISNTIYNYNSDEKPHIYIGAAKFSSSYKRNRSAPRTYLPSNFSSKVKCFKINEYLTSQLCNTCKGYLVDKDERIVRCKNVSCNMSFLSLNRDVNAAQNIRDKGIYYAQYNEHDPSFIKNNQLQEDDDEDVE